jgi:hypothetical protein
MLQQNIEPDAEGNNYRAPSSSRGDVYHSYLGKVTQNVGNHRMFVTFAHNTRHEIRARNGRSQLTATGNPNHYRWNSTVSFDWTTPMGPTMVSTFKAGWTNHNRRDGLEAGFSFDNATLGFQQSYLGLLTRRNFFQPVTIEDYNGANIGTADDGHLTNSHVYHASQVFTKIAGRHQIKVGGEFAFTRDRTHISVEGTEILPFEFTRHWTSARPTVNNLTAADGGNAFASFLLGFPREGRVRLGVAPTLNWHSQYFGAFVQDDWRVNDRGTSRRPPRNRTATWSAASRSIRPRRSTARPVQRLRRARTSTTPRWPTSAAAWSSPTGESTRPIGTTSGRVSG